MTVIGQLAIFTLLLLFTIGCNDNRQVGDAKTDVPIYSEEYQEFIKSADSVCKLLDAESIFAQIKDDKIVDRDGQTYPAHYTAFVRNSSDSITKILSTIVFSKKDSAKATIYYYNGRIIKGLTEIFADNPVKVAFYYNSDNMIYPNAPEMQESAEKLRRHSVNWKTYFPSLK